jgi:gliding motility-associated-like protein
MNMNFSKALLSISLMLFPILAFGQLPYSPCSPSGGKRADVLGVESKYRAPGGAAPSFTIPAGTRSIAVYVSSETGITSASETTQGDEDFITINAIIDLASNTSSGYVNYAKNTNTNGSGTNVYGWQKVALGALIPNISKVGDATPDLNNVNFAVSGSTLTITENATSIHSSYYVEYLSPYNNSLNPLAPQVRALLHGAAAANTDLSIPIPTGTSIVFISGKGTNSSPTDLNSAGGTEEGYSNLRFTMDLDAGLTDGFVTLANGGSVDRRSTYVINNMSNASTASLLSSSVITGDYTAKLGSIGAVGVYNPQIYVSGTNLIIKRDANYARDFDDAYVIEFYSRVGLGMSAEFISSDIKNIPSGVSATTGITRTFNIPTGTNFIYFNETGNAVNTDNEANENSLAAYASIDLATETATGYFYQQVGLSNSTRRDDNYAFKSVPLNNTSTRTHANTVGFLGPNPYDISFTLSADKSQLTVTNKTGLANPAYQFLLSADFYGSNPDIAFSTSNITFTKGASCNIVNANLTVCNPGAGNSSGGMPVSFYAGDPTVDPTAKLVYTGTFNQGILQGECKSFIFPLDLSSFSNLNVNITMIINDNGTFVAGGVGNVVGTPFTLSSLYKQNTGYKECYYDNNITNKTISVNNCPVVSLDPDKSSGASGKYNYLNYFTAGSPTGVKIVDNDLTIIDPDGTDVFGATITLTNILNVGNESLTLIGTLPTGIVMTGNGTGTITLTGQAPQASYVAALKMIEYRNTNVSPNTTNRIITTSVNDGIETGPASTTTIVILTTPQVNVIGGGITIVDAGTAVNIPDGTDYGVSLPTGAIITHTFNVQNLGTGTVTLTNTPRVSISGNPGFTISSQPATAAVPNGTNVPFNVQFNPAAHAVGIYTAVVTIVNNDPNTGRATYTYTVSATVNTIPVVSSSSASSNEDVTLAFTAANFTANYTDGDGTALNKIKILSVPLNGSFQLSGVVINVGQEIPAAQLANIRFIPTADWNGTTGFDWNGSDGTSYAAANAHMTVNIVAVNDAPVITLPTSIPVTEDIPMTLSGIVFTDADAVAAAVTATFTVPNGFFNAVSGSGVTVSGTPAAIVLQGSLADINAFIADDKLTYSSSQNPPSSVIVTVNINDNGNTGSGGALQDTKTIVLGITAVNDAPVAPGDAKTTAEDNPLNGMLPASDADGDVLTYTKATDPAHGTVTVNTNGTYTYTPVLNYNGPDSFTYTVSDGHGGPATATVNITVTPVNDLPVGTGDTRSTNEDTPVSGAVTGTDVDGDVLTYSITTNPTHGTVTAFDAATGAYTYTPDLNYNGTDNFIVTIDDGHGGSTTAAVNITINAVNDAPTGTGDTQTTPEETAVSGAVTGADVEGDPLTYRPGTAPLHGTVTVELDGTYTYTPAFDYNGGDNFTISISDGNDSIPVTVNITVTPVNDMPDPSGEIRTTPEDTPFSGAVSGTDIDGDTLIFSKGADPSHGTVITYSNGTYTYTPDPNYNGPDGFYFYVSDGNGGNGSAGVSITVTPVNDAPTGSGDTQTTPEDTDVSGAVTGADVDGDPLTYRPGTAPLHGTVTVNLDGTYTYTPALDYNGGDSFTISISDGNDSIPVTVTITVTPVNDMPDPSGEIRTTPEDIPFSGAVSGTDIDGDTLIFSKGADPIHGTVITYSNGTYTYTPDPNYNGPDGFYFEVSDGHGGSGTAGVSITVTPVNDAPTGTGDTQTTPEDADVSGAVTGADVDGDPLTYRPGTAPLHGTVTVNLDGTYTYTPALDYNGGDSFTISISDGNDSIPVTVSITVTAVNDAPTGTGDIQTTNEETPVSGAVTGADVDGDVLTYAITTNPLHGTVTAFNTATGAYTYSPALNYNGPDNFIITITDGHSGSTTAAVAITVTPVNDAPTGNGDTKTTQEDTAVSGAVTGADIDADVLTYRTGTAPLHGTVTVNLDGTYTYTPALDYNGGDNFTINISDGNDSIPVTVTITVTPVNDAPVGVSDDPTVNEDGSVNGAVTGTDADGDPLTYAPGTTPAHGTVGVNPDGTYTYTPATDYDGPDSFTIVITDGNGGTMTVIVNITVAPVNDAPTGTGDTQTTSSNTAVSGTVSGDDIDKDVLTFTKLTDPAHGTVTVNTDGTYTYTPNLDYVGADSFTITINDGHGGTVSVTVDITITNTPTADDDSVTTLTNKPVIIDVLTNDDPKSSTFDLSTIEIVTNPANGSVVINADGTITYTPAAGYNGVDSFTYRVSDANGGYSNPATVTVTMSSLDVNIPTLFTPNGDGKNDVFEIRDLAQYADNELIIVNRWGNEVFKQQDYRNTWTGKGLNDGTYYYLLRVKRNSDSKWEVIKGFITLLRSFKK